MSRKLRIAAALGAAALLLSANAAFAGGKTESGAAAAQKPAKVRFFYGTAGVQYPAEVKLDDNPFLNAIARQANVELVEITVPAYTDFQTKFNLMMTAGDLPDVIHCWFPQDVQKAGSAGAFLAWNDIIAKSASLSKKYTAAMQELMKDGSGNIYALRSFGAATPDTMGVRKDILDQIGVTVMPTDPQGWVDVFRKMKAADPQSVPVSAFNGLATMDTFFRAFGVRMGGNGAEWQLTRGTYINSFQAPLAKDAVLYYRKLYDEGYLDKTFMTNKAQDYTDRKLNRKLMIAPNGLTSVIAWITPYVTNKVANAMLVPAPLPLVNDPRIDIANVFTPLSALSGHCLSISGKTKEKEGAIRLAEALVSDETKLLSSWGREGIEYKVVNGVKQLDLVKTKETDYRRIYANMWVGASTDHVQVLLETKMGDLEEARRAPYRAAVEAGSQIAYEQAARVPSVGYGNFVDSQLPADTISRRAESYELSKTIIIKAIVGEITMAEYDAQAAEFVKKYQFITDSYNTVLKDVSSKIKL